MDKKKTAQNERGRSILQINTPIHKTKSVGQTFNIDKSLFLCYKKSSITKEYTLGRPIGGGLSSDVRMATHKDTGTKRVVKILKKSKIDEERFFTSVEILSKLSHPNILRVFEFFDDNRNYYIVEDDCPGGELFEQICSKGAFSERSASNLMKQILSAVSYSHKNKVIHK